MFRLLLDSLVVSAADKMASSTDVQVDHCAKRSVRREFLSKDDAVSAKNCVRSKVCIRNRLELLAKVFGEEVCDQTSCAGGGL